MRLIDADYLLDVIQYRLPITDSISQAIYDCVEITRKQIKNAPTIEAEPVKHEKWEVFLSDYGDCEMMSCSNCRSEFYDGDNDTVDNFPNYCPNCGAKMDLED